MHSNEDIPYQEDVIQGLRRAGGMDVPDTDTADEEEESVSDRTAFYDLQKKVLEYLVERSLHFKSGCKIENGVLSFEVEVFNDAPVGTVHYSRNRVY